MEINSFTTTQTDHHARLDHFLVMRLGVTRSQIQKMIDRKQVQVNDVFPTKNGQKLRVGDHITISEAEIEDEQQLPEVEIIAERDTYLVVNKPAGLLVHPTEAKEKTTLAAWIVKHDPSISTVGESPVRPGIVHRLDRPASGLLVIAKTQEMFEHLKEQFKKRTVKKMYDVLVYGEIEKDHDIIDFAIDRSRDGHMVARPHIDMTKLKHVGKDQPGKDAKTEFWVQKRFVRYTHARVQIHTGRMHQIRVHMKALDHPVVGDTLYQNKKLIKKSDSELGRLFLHASSLSFKDLSGETVSFGSPLPPELDSFLNNLT